MMKCKENLDNVFDERKEQRIVVDEIDLKNVSPTTSSIKKGKQSYDEKRLKSLG